MDNAGPRPALPAPCSPSLTAPHCPSLPLSPSAKAEAEANATPPIHMNVSARSAVFECIVKRSEGAIARGEIRSERAPLPSSSFQSPLWKFRVVKGPRRMGFPIYFYSSALQANPNKPFATALLRSKLDQRTRGFHGVKNYKEDFTRDGRSLRSV
jgi:hypothetical protein